MANGFLMLLQGFFLPFFFQVFLLPFNLMIFGTSYYVHDQASLPDYTVSSPQPPLETLEKATPIASIPDDPETIAKCLSKKGVKFYGAWWCPHCTEQKKMFGAASQYLPYTECDAKGANADTESCKNANVKAYPTWVFTDGSSLTGVQTMDDLAIKAGCTE